MPSCGVSIRTPLFSTSKFDVGQINTLRPATFEVVPVDSGRPVNIGPIVPYSGLPSSAPFGPRAPGAVSLLPGAPHSRAAGDFWTFLSFVEIGIILRTFHESISRRLKGRYYRHSFAHPFIYSTAVVSLFTVPSLSPYHTHLSFRPIFCEK